MRHPFVHALVLATMYSAATLFLGYVGLWSADATYKVGDVVERDGVYYRCLVAHGPEYQGTWGPPQASVWTDLGPVG